MQLVLGMASPSFFNELFSEGAEISRESLKDWFDSKTRTFGGGSAAVLSMSSGLESNTAFFLVRSRVTEQAGNVRQILFAVQEEPENAGQMIVLKDWEALDLLNAAVSGKLKDCEELEGAGEKLQVFVDGARRVLEASLPGYDLPFDLPETNPIAVLVPCAS